MRFLISVPDQLHAKLKAASKRRGQTLTGMIREVLWSWEERETSENNAEVDTDDADGDT